MSAKRIKSEKEPFTEFYSSQIDKAEGFNEIWKIVKETVKDTLDEHRSSMMLFLDNLPLYLGAYHPLGTNNIVLNRTLVEIISTTMSKQELNAFIYSILTHEYLHALGYVSESEVRTLVVEISLNCFGKDHLVTKLAETSPWTLLKDIPIRGTGTPQHNIEIIKDFENPNQKYII
jgi:hypothetical protein